MKENREIGGYGGLGDRRYERYCAAFDRVDHCVEAGYFLEAIALLDSLIWDRLSSRLGYVTGRPVQIKRSCRRICSELIAISEKGEHKRDAAFLDALSNITTWLDRRNDAVHATAKVFRDDKSEEGFSAILESHRQTAKDGASYLQAFDLLDTETRAEAGKIPASSPNAFFPKMREGQPRISTARNGIVAEGSAASPSGSRTN